MTSTSFLDLRSGNDSNLYRRSCRWCGFILLIHLSSSYTLHIYKYIDLSAIHPPTAGIHNRPCRWTFVGESVVVQLLRSWLLLLSSKWEASLRLARARQTWKHPPWIQKALILLRQYHLIWSSLPVSNKDYKMWLSIRVWVWSWVDSWGLCWREVGIVAVMRHARSTRRWVGALDLVPLGRRHRYNWNKCYLPPPRRHPLRQKNNWIAYGMCATRNKLKMTKQNINKYGKSSVTEDDDRCYNYAQ